MLEIAFARAHVFLVQVILLCWHRKWRSLDDIFYYEDRGVWPR
jgi:hypothetical protein